MHQRTEELISDPAIVTKLQSGTKRADTLAVLIREIKGQLDLWRTAAPKLPVGNVDVRSDAETAMKNGSAFCIYQFVVASLVEAKDKASKLKALGQAEPAAEVLKQCADAVRKDSSATSGRTVLCFPSLVAICPCQGARRR